MIDTHAHLLCLENMDEVISSMNDDGLDYIVNIGTTKQDSLEGVKLAEINDMIYTTVGIYPEYANDVTYNDLEEIRKLCSHEKVVAVGEIGLDYHGESYNKERQRELFIEQLKIADMFGLPFCIHCRCAADDLYDILLENKNLINHSGVMHCYSEGAKYIKKFVDLGMYISFSGNITFKKSDRSFLKDIPLDRILVETDSPYLSPEPLRGRKNTPQNVKCIIEKIASELEIDFDKLEKITTQNARKLYYKIK